MNRLNRAGSWIVIVCCLSDFIRLSCWICFKNNLRIVVAGPKQSCPSIIYHHLPFVKGIPSNLSINQPTNGSLGHLIYPIGSMYGIYANMDPIRIPHMLAYIPYMDLMGMITNWISTWTSMVKRVPSRGQDGSVRDVARFHHLHPVASETAKTGLTWIPGEFIASCVIKNQRRLWTFRQRHPRMDWSS